MKNCLLGLNVFANRKTESAWVDSSWST